MRLNTAQTEAVPFASLGLPRLHGLAAFKPQRLLSV
jgi:hypothetical protein